MANVRAQVILKTVDAIPANYVTNTFAFEMNTAGTVVTDVVAAIKGLYDAVRPYLAPVLAQNGHMIKFTDIEGAAPNYPFDERTFNLSAALTGNSIPREVALVASFQGDRVSGQVQARRRGRIYLGPLNNAALFNDGNPTGACVLAIVAAMDAFKDAIDAITVLDGVVWIVWSGVNGSGTPVTNGWVDNVFDTQRSRGNAATGRNIWP